MKTVKIAHQTAAQNTSGKVKVSSCKLANLKLTTYIIRSQATTNLN